MATATINDFVRRLKRGMASKLLENQSDRELVERFLAHRDESVFEALVHRHGPMVYHVCWRVLQQDQDAEDAFQATFLLLAEKLPSLRNQDSLAAWLHSIAHRLALRAQSQAVSRRVGERASGSCRAVPSDDSSWLEVRTLLDEEMAKLPDKWRLPLILCCLECRTQEEAATQLRWSKNTLRRRLDEAREALGRRLTRRGIACSAALAAVLFSDSLTPAAPSSLVASTVDAATAVAAGRTAISVAVSHKVSDLAKGVLDTMVSRKLKTGALVAVLGFGCWAAAHLAQTFLTQDRGNEMSTDPTSPQLGFRGSSTKSDRGKDVQRLQGAWEVENVRGDGLDDQIALADQFRWLTLVIQGDRVVTFDSPDGTIARLEINSEDEPKRIDLTQTTRLLGEAKVLHWAYALDDDRLTIVFRKDNLPPNSTVLAAPANGWSKTVQLSFKRAAQDIHEWKTPPGGTDANDLRMFAAAAREISQAKTVTWETTMYVRRTADGRAGPLMGSAYRRSYYKTPGLYREETINDKQQITWINIDDVVGLRRLSIDSQKKTAVLQHISEPRLHADGPFPHQVGRFSLNGKSLIPIAPEKIGTQEVLGYRFAFHLPREDQRWSYDFLFDAKTRKMTGYRVPGLALLDPNKIYDQRTLKLEGGVGYLWHDIKFNVDLDDELFRLDPPQGYQMSVRGIPRVHETDVVEFLGIVADYMGGTFPRDVLEFNSGPEYLRFERIEREKSRTERTLAENRMVDAMHRWWSQDVPGPGPMHLFINNVIEKGSWRYMGEGVKRGDGTRPVCLYRRRGQTTFRVIYGDLSVREVSPQQLPNLDK